MEENDVMDKELLKLVETIFKKGYIQEHENVYLGVIAGYEKSIVMEMYFSKSNTEDYHYGDFQCYWADLLATEEDDPKELNHSIPAFLMGVLSQVDLGNYWCCVDRELDSDFNMCNIEILRKRK